MSDINLSTEAPAAAAEGANPNVITFVIPGSEPEVQMAVDLDQMPAAVRLDFLKTAVRNYVVNPVNQVSVRHTKDSAGWAAYDEATKANPLQTAVPKPAGERPVLDQSKLIDAAKAARERLYKGEIRKQGDGTGKKQAKADPLDAMVTRAVVTELFEKRKVSTPGVKYTDITSEVAKAGGGIAYLDQMIAEKVAAAPEAEQATVKANLDKFKESRYINPAKLMLGQRDTAGTKDQSLL